MTKEALQTCKIDIQILKKLCSTGYFGWARYRNNSSKHKRKLFFPLFSRSYLSKNQDLVAYHIELDVVDETNYQGNKHFRAEVIFIIISFLLPFVALNLLTLERQQTALSESPITIFFSCAFLVLPFLMGHWTLSSAVYAPANMLIRS